MPSLAERLDAQERMDTECRDYADYARCLRDLARVNATTRTTAPILKFLALCARGRPTLSVLDVACGHGDVLRRIRRWSNARRVSVTLTGIDLNPWAIRAATEATRPADDIAFHQADVFAYDSGLADVVISSQFAHHLTHEDLVRFIAWMETHAMRGWMINDLRRHAVPYYGFPLLARAAGWHRFVRQDGQTSIARAFREPELRAAATEAGVDPAAIAITHPLPFRIAMTRLR